MQFDTYQKRIKFARERLGYNQTEVAKAVGIKQATYSLLESGKSEGSKYTAEIANYLRVNALWLATGKGKWTDVSAYAESLDSSDSTGLQLLQAFEAISQYAPEEKDRILRVLQAYLDE